MVLVRSHLITSDSQWSWRIFSITGKIYIKGYRDTHPINILLMFQLSFCKMVRGGIREQLKWFIFDKDVHWERARGRPAAVQPYNTEWIVACPPPQPPHNQTSNQAHWSLSLRWPRSTKRARSCSFLIMTNYSYSLTSGGGSPLV